MITILLSSILSIASAADMPKDSQGRYDALMAIWNEMTFERRDNFLSQMKGAAKKDSDGSEAITAREYEALLKMSKQKNIPAFKDVDTTGRPENRDERRNIVQETCERFKGNMYKRCEQKWFSIVDFTSEEQDEISNEEWDAFMALVKKLKAESKSK